MPAATLGERWRVIGLRWAACRAQWIGRESAKKVRSARNRGMNRYLASRSVDCANAETVGPKVKGTVFEEQCIHRKGTTFGSHQCGRARYRADRVKTAVILHIQRAGTDGKLGIGPSAVRDDADCSNRRHGTRRGVYREEGRHTLQTYWGDAVQSRGG